MPQKLLLLLKVGLCVILSNDLMKFLLGRRLCWSAQMKTVSLSSHWHFRNRRGDLYVIKSTDCDVRSVSFTIFNHHFLWTQRMKQNNQQQKQPTQETKHSICNYSRNTVKKITQTEKPENKANRFFLNMPHYSLGKFSFTESHLFY